MTTSELLRACLSAFNEIPNKTLNNNKGGFKSSYDIASAIEKHLPKTKSLHEAIADIAYFVGYRKFTSGDSRQDVSDIIEWAKEFEKIHEKTDWSLSDVTYMEAIDEFSEQRIKDFSK